MMTSPDTPVSIEQPRSSVLGIFWLAQLKYPQEHSLWNTHWDFDSMLPRKQEHMHYLSVNASLSTTDHLLLGLMGSISSLTYSPHRSFCCCIRKTQVRRNGDGENGKNGPADSAACVLFVSSGMDDVFFSYITGVLEELGSPESSEETFDMDTFVEMMEAYIPGFAEIHRYVIGTGLYVYATHWPQAPQYYKFFCYTQLKIY